MFYGLRELLIMAVLGLVAKFVGVGVMLAGVFAYVFGAFAYDRLTHVWRQFSRQRSGRSQPRPRSPEEAKLVEASVQQFSDPKGTGWNGP